MTRACDPATPPPHDQPHTSSLDGAEAQVAPAAAAVFPSVSAAAPLGRSAVDAVFPSVSDSGTTPAAEPAGSLPEAEQRRLELERCWNAITVRLLEQIKPDQFETWFRRACLKSVGAQGVCLAVQNNFARDWLLSHYLKALEQAAQSVLGGESKVSIEVDAELCWRERRSEGEGEPQTGSGSSAREDKPARKGPEADAAAARPAGALPAGLPTLVYSDSVLSPRSLLGPSDFSLNNQYRFENFVVGPCNRFAHAAAVGVSESPGRVYNPFFLHGGVGLGKTHLLQSLCAALLERDPSTRILFLSCETFVNHFISALENGDLSAFRNKYRNVDVLVVDDIHMLANKERTQEEFFNTFNTLYNAGKQIVLSSDSSPKEIPALQERLVSRFKWGLVTEIEKPCYETRMAILRRKGRARGRELPEDVASLIAENIDSNIRELEGAVTRVLGFAMLNSKEVTVELARSVLQDSFVSRRAATSIDDVLKVVTAQFNVRIADLQSKRRTNAIVQPRQVAMYLARRITRHSLEEIGRFFGGRDHSTVLYAVEKIESMMRSDERFRAMMVGFLDRLGKPSA